MSLAVIVLFQKIAHNYILILFYCAFNVLFYRIVSNKIMMNANWNDIDQFRCI